MFKTISAALLAVSVLAAPAMAAGTDNTTTTPATTTAPVKSSALKAHASMSRHHYRHSHRKIGALKTHHLSKVSAKHVKSATKRG